MLITGNKQYCCERTGLRAISSVFFSGEILVLSPVSLHYHAAVYVTDNGGGRDGGYGGGFR